MKAIIALFTVIILSMPVTAWSQTRRRTRPAPRATAAAQAKQLAEARQKGAASVATQIKDLSRFVYLMGGVNKGIEEMDAAAQRTNSPKELLEQTKKSRGVVGTSIRVFREKLDKLEAEFFTTDALKPYYTKLAGVAAVASKAEQQVANNELDQAGRSLLAVINRLTDVLVEMR